MQAIVVYESVWGNTAAIAQAIAEGLNASASKRQPRGGPASPDLRLASPPAF